MITVAEMEKAVFRSIDVPRRMRIRFGFERIQLNAVPSHSMFAAFIYSSIARAMSDSGWRVETFLHQKDFVFSMGRANILSTVDKFSYVKFRKNRRIYELHCGLNVQSNVQDIVIEIDVLVIPQSHGKVCRANGSQVNFKEVKTLLEIKHYERRFDVSKATEFVGKCKLVRYREGYAGLVVKGQFTADALKLFTNIRPKIGAFPDADLAGAKAMADDVLVALKKILT